MTIIGSLPIFSLHSLQTPRTQLLDVTNIQTCSISTFYNSSHFIPFKKYKVTHARVYNSDRILFNKCNVQRLNFTFKFTSINKYKISNKRVGNFTSALYNCFFTIVINKCQVFATNKNTQVKELNKYFPSYFYMQSI